MAEQIKGFTISLDLDSIKVDSGLQDVKRSMRQMNSEMRKTMSSYDYSEKSMKKYGDQLGGLNKKLELQKTTTESARKHYEKMAETHGESSKEAQKAATAYNNESAQLNNLERHIGRVTKEMNEFKRQQDIQSTSLWKTGDALEGFGDGLGKVSERAREVGGTLTKSITLPALGVATAVGGIVAAFGWQRLVAVDTAQAQLKGLGYSTEDVGRITEQVTTAIEGGMTTMAEGTAIAAGAMAAGVKEGAELERYIKLVGDAAVGSNRPVNEMSQIFNRVQGSGKLMTQELNMIEQGMPGFAMAMSESLGVSQEEFRKMVTAGEVGSKEFLDVMDDFAGGMAGAYADSWQGMVANTKAYIGIIGENLLGGVFEESKESIAEFIEILSSEEMVTWAEEMGEKIGEVFTSIVDSVKTGIEWFNNLSDGQKKAITAFGAFAVAIGPLLLGFGLLGGVIAKVSSGLGVFFKWLAPILTPLKGVGVAAGEAGKSVGLLSRVFTFLTGPVGIIIGVVSLLVGAFVLAYKKSETFRNFIHLLGDKIKEIFSSIMDWVQPGIDAIVNFFESMKEKITSFKEEEGAQLTEAFENIKIVTGVVFGFIGRYIVDQFEKVKVVIEFLMPFIEEIIKSVWGSIKLIISGALDIIMGAIRIFSGLFTADWSKMWEGVKDIGKGLINIIWGLIKDTFIGRIIKGIIGFVMTFRQRIDHMWYKTKITFINFIVQIYKHMQDSFIGRIILSIIGFVANFRENITDLWKRVKSTFTTKIKEIRDSISNSFVGRMLRSIRTLKTDFIKLAGDMWTGVKGKFDDIVDGAKALPGRIGRGISNAKDKAVRGMKTVGNSLITWAGTPFNRVVGGVNWITGKLGIKKKIPYWNYPQYAKGTGLGGHKGGSFIAGERGRELVKLPDGRSFLTPNAHTFYPDMPKGTHVIPNKQTEDMLKFDLPHYAKGTSGWQSVIGDVWDYIKNPSKVVSKIWDNIAIKSGMAEIPRNIVSGGMGYLKDKATSFVKGGYKKAEAQGGGRPAFKWPITSRFGYRVHPIFGTSRLHAGTDFGAPHGAPIPSTTGGTVSYAGRMGGFGNLVKVRQGIWEMYYAHLSRILTSVGRSVSKGDILGLVGSTGDSTGPHLHYETRKNGVPVNPMGLKGFATGGVIKSKMMAMLGEDGEEVVIPTAPNRRTDAMKLLALAAKKIGADNGSYSRPSSVKSHNGGSSEEINLLRQQVQLLTELVLSNKNIEKKPILSEGDIKRSYDKVDSKHSNHHGIFTGRPGGAY